MSRMRRWVPQTLVLLFYAAFALPAAAAAGAATNACDRALPQRISARLPLAPSGSEFARLVAALSEDDREQAIETELLAGNLPAFLGRLVPVALSGKTPDGRSVQVTVCVLPDYLAIGSDRDFLYVPMRLATALKVAARYGLTLPTAKIVDAIYEQSAVHLTPQPLPAGDRMRTTAYYEHHNELIEEQRSLLGASLGVLTAGHKKDLVITNRLRRFPDRVAIYGWHRGVNDPIQPLSTVHGARYADYSHGVRLVGAVVYVDGAPKPMPDALADPELASVISGEGPIPQLAELTAILAPSAERISASAEPHAIAAAH
jgi:hypothetical protein